MARGRVTEQRQDEIIARTVELMQAGHLKGVIKKSLKAEYGVAPRTVEDYIARAREILLLQLREDRDCHKANALGFYRSLVASEETSVMEKIKAQSRIDFLLGLNAPTTVAMTDADGNTLTRAEVETEIDYLAQGLLGAD